MSKIEASLFAFCRRVYRGIKRKHSLAKFALKRSTQTPALASEKIEVLVISPGGVATTMLLEYLERYVSTNSPNDTDGLKHLPFPPPWLKQAGQKVIFVSGEAELICSSIERRGWLDIQAAKLGSIGAVILPAPLARIFFRRAVRRQICRWRSWCTQEHNSGLFIPFSDIWMSIEQIAAFCRIEDPGFVNSFPKQRERTTVKPFHT